MVADDLADHGCMSVDVLECFEGERSDTIRAVAFEAVLLEDPGDAVMPRDIRSGGFCDGILGFNSTAGSGSGGDFGSAVIENGIDGFDEKLIAGLIECRADGVLIIDSTVIEDGAFGIEENDIGGGGGIEECSDVFILVGRVDSVCVECGCGFLHIRELIRGDAVDEYEGDGFVGAAFGDMGKCGEIFAAERAGGAGEGDDGCGRVIVIGEFVSVPCKVREVEVGD